MFETNGLEYNIAKHGLGYKFELRSLKCAHIADLPIIVIDIGCSIESAFLFLEFPGCFS